MGRVVPGQRAMIIICVFVVVAPYAVAIVTLISMTSSAERPLNLLTLLFSANIEGVTCLSCDPPPQPSAVLFTPTGTRLKSDFLC